VFPKINELIISVKKIFKFTTFGASNVTGTVLVIAKIKVNNLYRHRT
jgi:hypothetical protein